jgi:hypothetical protein
VSVKVYTEYECRKGHTWHKYWHRYPWFGDYATNCPRCGRSTWPNYRYDDSREEISHWKRTDN